MIKKYFEHIQSKTPHHRRQHALQVAGFFTAFAFIVWISTLGMRFGSIQNGSNKDQSQLAGAAAANDTSQSGLVVVASSTNDFSNYTPINQ